MHGTVKETRYHTSEHGGALEEAETLEASTGDITFINGAPRAAQTARARVEAGSVPARPGRSRGPPPDSIALHKVGNPRADDVAATLHLYAPPFQQCRVWLDPADASKVRPRSPPA